LSTIKLEFIGLDIVGRNNAEAEKTFDLADGRTIDEATDALS